MDASPHRKRVKHFDEPRHAHELTFSCFHRLPLLTREDFKTVLAESIDRANQIHHFRLLGFVFMPEHVHLVVYPRDDSARVAGLLYAIKRPMSFRVKQLLEGERNPLLRDLTIRERPGKTTFRFWQEGPGYDRNLTSRETVLTVLDYLHENPVRRGLVPTAAEWIWSSWSHYHRPEMPREPRLPRLAALADWF